MADTIQVNGDAPEVLTSRKASPESELRPGEADLVEWVEGMYDDAEAGRREQCGDPGDWDDAVSTYWGDQWKGTTLPTYKAPIVLNELKSLALQELSDLTDSRIVIHVEKDVAGRADSAAEKSMQATWARYFMDLTLLSAALDALIYPLGFLQSGFDPLSERGQGVVTLKARNPRSVYPDPDAETDEDARYMILEDVMDLVEIHARWPETGPRVGPEANYSIRYEKNRERPGPKPGSNYTGPLYSKLPGVTQGFKKARARVLTCIVQDEEQIEEMRPIIVEGVTVGEAPIKKYRYPDRRLIQIAGQRVLYDGNNQYRGAPIITRVALQPTVHSYWPSGSIIRDFTAVQQGANKADSLVLENIMRLNGGQGFADADTGIDPQRMANVPGQWTLIRPGTRMPEIKYPSPMPGEMVNLGERFRGFIRGLMGYPLSRTGAGTHGNVAAELAETEISQSMGITRLRGRLLHVSTQKAVEMLFSRMAQFYLTRRHIPYLVGQKWEQAQWEPVVNPEQYAVLVDPATFAVRSKTMMQRLYFTLARMGKMPTEDLLKALEVPDADGIAGRLKSELILMAMARMKQGKGGKKAGV